MAATAGRRMIYERGPLIWRIRRFDADPTVVIHPGPVRRIPAPGFVRHPVVGGYEFPLARSEGAPSPGAGAGDGRGGPQAANSNSGWRALAGAIDGGGQAYPLQIAAGSEDRTEGPIPVCRCRWRPRCGGCSRRRRESAPSTDARSGRSPRGEVRRSGGA